MSQAIHGVYYSYAEYLALAETSTVKLEFLDGQIYAMAGGTPEHGALAIQLVAGIGKGSCRVFSSDVRVRVEETGLGTYPDVSVVFGSRRHDPDDPHAIVNPVVIVEVTSKSTAAYDRGEKFDLYRRILSLEEYVLVSHDTRAIEVRRRSPDGSWASSVAGPGGRAALASLGCGLDVDIIYDGAADPR